MKVKLRQIGDATFFEGSTDKGGKAMFHVPAKGEEANAPGPMETLLMAVAACGSVDVVNILRKMREELEDLEVVINGSRTPRGDAKPFSAIDLEYRITGDVDVKKAEKAVKMAVEKYCSVSESLDKDIDISWKVVVCTTAENCFE